MSEVTVKELQCGIIVTTDPVIAVNPTYTTFIQYKAPLPVEGDSRLGYNSVTEEVIKSVNEILAEMQPNVTKWQLYVALDGRCWFIEPLSNGEYNVGHLDYPTNSDWRICGIEVKD